MKIYMVTASKKHLECLLETVKEYHGNITSEDLSVLVSYYYSSKTEDTESLINSCISGELDASKFRTDKKLR